MYRRGGLIVAGLILSSLLAFADIADTVICIDQVVAKGVRFEHYSIGAKILKIDSAMLQNYAMNSLAELLSQHSLVNVTSYGPGGQSGIKMRGGGADHTTIIWNGLNIKPPMSGELNASSINSGIFDNIHIQPGGSSTMYGTGATTGVVYLSNKLNINDSGIEGNICLEGGSFDTYGGLVSGNYAGKFFSSKLSVSYQESANNFEFLNSQRFGKPTEIQQHAGYATVSIGQQNAIKLGAKSRIETDLWYSKHFKQIPSLISDPETGKTEQTDNNINFALNFSKYSKNWFLKYRGGILAYKQNYLGYDTNYYNAINKSRSIINEVESKYSFSDLHKIYVGINNTIDIATSDSYTSTPLRNQISAFARYSANILKDKILLNLDGRQSIVDRTIIPFVYSAGLSIEVVKGISVKALGSKNYSLPDLNDLYWSRSAFAEGNSNLEPEYGWSTEGGIVHQYSGNLFHFNHELTVYKSSLTNAIIWLDVGENNRWIPRNYDGAVTKGIEFTGYTSLITDILSLKLGYDYTYTHARIEDSDNEVDFEGTQRRYIPEHKVGIRIVGQFKNLSVAIYNQYVSERSVDETTSPIEAYNLMDVKISYGLKFETTNLHIFAKVKNITNSQYQIMAGYVQPPRGFYYGINYKF